MKKFSQRYSIVNNVVYLFRAIADAYPLLFVFILLQIILSVATPVLSIYLPSLAVSLVTDQADTTTLLLKLGGFGLLLAILLGLNQMAATGKYMMHNSMRSYFQKKLFGHSMYCDYIHIESKEGQTKYQRAMDTLLSGDNSGTSRMQVSVIALITNVLCFTLYSGILTTLHPSIVLFLVGISLLNLFLTKAAQNYEHGKKDAVAGLNQKLQYVQWTAREVQYGKDIRLYNMSNWFITTRDSLSEAYCRLKNQIQQRYFIVSCANTVTLLLRDGVAYGCLIYYIAAGKISVSNFVLYFGAITGFSSFVQNIINHFNWLQDANLKMNDMRAFLDTTNEPEPENPAKLPDSEQLSIEFAHVWFSYERGGTPILKDFCLHINAGEKIALVGVNGAGKTTLVKLLCGLYTPDQGVIRINGTDIRQFRKKDLFSLFSAVFQDVNITPHTVAENVSMAPQEETDMNRVESCLKQAGLLEIINTYPDGIRSYMKKVVHAGIILSGGQQQKLLMARALYKDAPIMVLDEPTAALDPIAESETYESFHKISGTKTVIYISHRLASTRFCDRIIFLNDGQVAENDTHNELMQQDGYYAEMFEMQSHYYQIKEADKEVSF